MAKDGISTLLGTTSRGAGKVSASIKSSSSSNGGAKARVSDRLEEDAQVMEERLIQLRMKMIEDKQRFEKELPAKFGGSRWRSAQESIGSVSRYAKDLEEKATKGTGRASKKRAESSESVAAEPKTKSKKKPTAQPPLITSISAIKKWKCAQVLEWLASIGLDEYHPTFEFHQVTGLVLLDLRIDELTQIGVDRLSARNRIWSELERIKATTSGSSACLAGEIVDPKLKDVPAVPEIDSPDKKGTHWSHVKPLRDEDATNKGGDLPVNLADGEFDEDASHASFMKALLDWRAGDGETQAKDTEQNDDDLWFNPMINTSNNEGDSETGDGGGALLNGDYDEEKEQEAFRRAVLAWRQGTKSTESTRPSTSAVDKAEQSISTDQKKSCWHCYRVVPTDLLMVDPTTNKAFCGGSCIAGFKDAFARLYEK